MVILYYKFKLQILVTDINALFYYACYIKFI